MASDHEEEIQRNFENPDEQRRFEQGRADVVTVGGVTAMYVTFEPGWTWSDSLKPVAGGERCEVAHKWYVVSGRMRMRMQDGRELEWKAGDVGVVPPGHDAWVVGDEPFVFVDFEGGGEFAKRRR